MIELHCHVLPFVDDGADDMKVALTMLRRMQKDGVTHVVATPHCTRGIRLFRRDIVPRVAQFNADAKAAGIENITVFPGSEISFYDVEDYRAHYEDGTFCHYGGGSEYSLLEFPWARADAPRDSLQHIEWLVSRGTTPILAHPERTPFLRENPKMLKQMHDAGAWIQITVDSLFGRIDGMTTTIALALLRTFPNVVLATDSHNLNRCSPLSEGYAMVAQSCGEERANDLWQRADLVRHSVENVSNNEYSN